MPPALAALGSVGKTIVTTARVNPVKAIKTKEPIEIWLTTDGFLIEFISYICIYVPFMQMASRVGETGKKSEPRGSPVLVGPRRSLKQPVEDCEWRD